jgi:hypothetical protein
VSDAAVSNGFRLRGLNADSDRVAVQSSISSTWMLTYKRWGFNQWSDVCIHRDELIVLKCQGGEAELELEPLGDKAGALIAQSSRRATRTMRVGQRYRFALERGEALVLRSTNILHPTHAGAGMTV